MEDAFRTKSPRCQTPIDGMLGASNGGAMTDGKITLAPAGPKSTLPIAAEAYREAGGSIESSMRANAARAGGTMCCE
ncbi:hypothetical protein H3V53_00690 [Paraburkholderia bengalensis]|uniref:Uncharacterized protein n=1 Tax=Paraburkholderia bengalensis TaxID=2747562 RepID=A0ABU8IJV4_9BURK